MKSIEIQNATKTYPNGVTALKDVSCTIHQGEFVVVMGQSGSGKSTFLQIAGLLDTPSSGHVVINGRDTASLKKKRAGGRAAENTRLCVPGVPPEPTPARL